MTDRPDIGLPRRVIAERLSAQLLAGAPARDPLAVVERLLAVQGQDPRGARLAIRVRSSGLSATDVDRALTEKRSLLITWLNRGTLHLVRSEDYPWLQALTTPPLLRGSTRRLRGHGITATQTERAVALITAALADDGPLTRAALGERLRGKGIPTAGQVLVELLMLACLRGLTVRGPMVGKEHAYALVHDWLGRPQPVDRDRALAELARRYLAGHGPADERDLAKWAGLPLRDVRTGLGAIASELAQRPDGLLALATTPSAKELPPPRLLGAFDPLLMGHRSRDQILSDRRSSIITANGIFRPFALVRARAVATWRMPAGKVMIEGLSELSRPVRAALEREAQEVVDFLGSNSAARSYS